MSLLQELEEARADLSASREALAAEPASRLINLIPHSGEYKGEVRYLTTAQYRTLKGGRYPPKSLTDSRGRIPWEYVLDDLATEMGYGDEHTLKRAIERALKAKRRIDALAADVARLEDARQQALERCTLSTDTLPCTVAGGRAECKARVLACGDYHVAAVRHPAHWTGHYLLPGEEPTPDNQATEARYARQVRRWQQAQAADVAAAADE